MKHPLTKGIDCSQEEINRFLRFLKFTTIDTINNFLIVIDDTNKAKLIRAFYSDLPFSSIETYLYGDETTEYCGVELSERYYYPAIIYAEINKLNPIMLEDWQTYCNRSKEVMQEVMIILDYELKYFNNINDFLSWFNNYKKNQQEV